MSTSIADAPLHTSCAGGVFTITLSRPPVNAFDDTLVGALRTAVAAASADPGASVLHLRSAGRVFCAGADLALMQASIQTAEGLERMLALVRGMQDVFQRIEAAPLVSIAEIGGAALGGGFEMALACDLRIAAHEARLGLPEVGLGLLAAAGGTQRLTRLVGPGLAKRLMLGAEAVDGATAERLGLVQWSHPRAQLAPAAQALTERIAALPRAAKSAVKQCVAAALDPTRDGFAEELDHTRDLYGNPVTRELVTGFLARNAR